MAGKLYPERDTMQTLQTRAKSYGFCPAITQPLRSDDIYTEEAVHTRSV